MVGEGVGGDDHLRYEKPKFSASEMSKYTWAPILDYVADMTKIALRLSLIREVLKRNRKEITLKHIVGQHRALHQMVRLRMLWRNLERNVTLFESFFRYACVLWKSIQ